uniref:MFS transporter n=1 Tax=Thermorudis sp. TaxID=1969470 RepID=A0A7C3A8C9_9BACT
MREPQASIAARSPVAAARALWAARLVVFVAFFDLFVQYPLAAPYAEWLGAAPALTGFIVASYSIANLAGNIGAGMLLDRFGRARPLVLALLGTALVLAAYTMVRDAYQLIIVRLLHGLAVATLAPGAFALIGDLTAPDERARAMGINGALIAIAAMVAPPLAGVLQDRLGYEPIFLADAALMALAVPVTWLALRRVHVEPAAPSKAERSHSVDRYLTLARRPRLALAYATILTFTVSLGFLVTHLPLAIEVGGGTAPQRGLAFSIYALVAALVMASPLTRYSDRRGRSRPLGLGLLLVGLGLLTLALGLARPALVLGMTSFGLGFGLLFPSASALVVEASAPAERGSAFGLFYALYSVGVIVGATLSGLLASWAGMASPLPFLISGFLSATAGPVILLGALGGSRDAS